MQLIKSMPLHTLLSLALFLCFLQVGDCQSCQTCFDLRFYSCKVCYNNCSQVSQNMSRCEWTYCAESYYDYSTNSTQCSRYQTDLLPQDKCFSKCCQSSQNYFSVEELKRCYNQSEENMKIAMIVGGVIGGIFILIFLFCCIRSGALQGLRDMLCGCCCDCSCSCNCGCGCCRYMCEDLEGCFGYICSCRCFRSDPKPQNPEGGQGYFQDAHHTKPLEWMHESNQVEKLNDEEENCSICLSNKVETVARCRHSFHLECIQAWFNRNEHCPLCKSIDVADIKFFCRGCCQQYLKFNLKTDKNIQEKIIEMKGPNCPICQ